MQNSKAKWAILTILVAFVAAMALGEDVDTNRFHVTFPEWCGQINKTEQNVNSPSGPIQQVTYRGTVQGGAACIVTFSQLKATINDPMAMMKSGRDSLLNALKAKLENENDTKIAGQPGMTLLYSATSQRPIFARTDLIVRDKRMYQIIFIGFSQDQRSKAESSPLFNSFSLKPVAKEEAKTAAKATTPPAPATTTNPADPNKD